MNESDHEELATTVRRLEEALGEAPAPMLGRPGSGLLAAVTTLSTTVTELGGKVAELAAELGAERALKAQRRDRWEQAVKIAVVPMVGAAVTALVHFLSQFHR